MVKWSSIKLEGTVCMLIVIMTPKYKLPFFPLLLALLLVLIITFYVMFSSFNLLFGFTWRQFFINYVHRIWRACSFLSFKPQLTKPAPCIFHFKRSPLKLLRYIFCFAKHRSLKVSPNTKDYRFRQTRIPFFHTWLLQLSNKKNKWQLISKV